MRLHVRRNSITQDDTVSLFLITPVQSCSFNFHFSLGVAVIGLNSGKGFFSNKTNHKTWGAMPLAKPVCVAHWRAEIRPFNCTFCNLPSHCLISSNEKPGCWYGILQKGKINISSTKTTDALFSKDWSVVSCNSNNPRQRAMTAATSNETLRDISGILNTLTETIVTYTNANQPTCPEDSAISDYVTPL